MPAIAPADVALFNLYVASQLDIERFLRASKLSAAEFVRWASRPEIDVWVESYQRLLRRAREESAELDRSLACSQLRQILEQPAASLVERRRQIATLNRTLSMRLFPAAAPSRPPPQARAQPAPRAADDPAAPILAPHPLSQTFPQPHLPSSMVPHLPPRQPNAVPLRARAGTVPDGHAPLISTSAA